MSNGTLSLVSSNLQYKKYNYTYSGTSYSNIHVFATNSAQSIAPAISTSRVALSSINPATVSSNNVIAKINGCMFNYNSSDFYGFFYQGSGYPMYVEGDSYNNYTDIPSSSWLYNDPKYYPSFCVKSDGSATIRWFSSSSELGTALQYCSYVIGSAHPLVYNSKCVFNESVQDSAGVTIYSSTNNGTRFNEGIGTGSSYTSERTLLGHIPYYGNAGTYIMVCADTPMLLETAANMMQDLGCDYAVAMDCGTPYEMRIKSGYGANGKVTSGIGHTLNTAVCAYVK